MAIQIANLTAQVGADTTQFKMGMKEVEARLEQVKSRADTVINRVNTLQRKAREAAEDAADFLAAAQNATDPIKQAKLLRRGQRAAARGQDNANQAADLERDAAAAEQVAKAYAARLNENAREHQVRAFNAVSAAAIRTGTAMTAGFVGATLEGAKFNSMLLTTVHNTSLSADGAQKLRETVAKLGTESGADLQELAHGFQKIENFSFSAADSAKILDVAMKSSVGTGADLDKTAELLAKSLVQFKLGATDASRAMNTMHVAANLSSLEMSQLVEVGGQTYSMAANLGIGFVEANAAIVTFTKMGLNAHEAMTQFRGELNKLIHPTKQVKEMFGDIKAKSGVDLAKTFELTSLKSKGLAGSFGDIRLAAQKMGVDVRSLANELFPNMRGTIGAMISSSDNGFKIFNETVDKLNEAFSGRLDPNTKQYEETLQSTQAQINRAKNAIVLLEGTISGALSPTVVKITGFLQEQTKAFGLLSPEVQRSKIEALAFGGVALIVLGGVGKLLVGIASLREAFIALTGIETARGALTAFSGAVGGLQTRIILLSRAQLMLAGTLGIAALAVAAVAGGVAYYNSIIDGANEEQNGFNKRQQEAAEKALSAAKANQENASRLSDLVKQYEELHKISKPTAEQTGKLHGVLNEISVLAPSIIQGFDKTGQAVGLVGDYAKYSAAQLADMNRQLQIAEARKVANEVQSSREVTGRLSGFIAALKKGDIGAYNDMWRDEALLNGVLGNQMYLGSDPSDLGKKFNAMGIKPMFSDNEVGDFNNKKWRDALAKKLESIQAQNARLENMSLKSVTDIFHPSDVKKPGADGSSAEGGGAYHPPTKDKDKKKKDPLEVYRNFIEANNEKIFKALSNDPLKDSAWLEFDEQKLRPQLDGIKSLEVLMDMARSSASNLESALKRVAENKSFDTAIAAAKAMGHKPKSERLGDVARWEVGDPYQDVWSNHLYDMGGKTKMNIWTPDSLTGNDPSKKNWFPNKKKQYIDAMEAEQRRRDLEKADEQHKKLIEDITRKEEKQKSVFEQTIAKVRELPELYARVGEFGAFMYASIAQASADNAKVEAQTQENLKKYAEERKKFNEDAISEVLSVQGALAGAKLDVTGFGQQMTTEAYQAEYALKHFGKAVRDLTLDEYLLTVIVAGFNEQVAKVKVLKDYTSSINELKASIRSFMTGGANDYEAWLIKTTGMDSTQMKAAGGYKGLTEDQYRKQFDLMSTNNQADKYRQQVEDLKRTRVEMGLVRFSSYEAEIAYRIFGTSLNKLTPEMVARVKELGQQFKTLEHARKIQLIWQTTASTLEQAFTSAFDGILVNHEDFWKTLTNSIKNNISQILAAETSKEIVRFIGKVTGFADRGKIKEDGSGSGIDTIPNMYGKDVQKVFVVNMSAANGGIGGAGGQTGNSKNQELMRNLSSVIAGAGVAKAVGGVGGVFAGAGTAFMMGGPHALAAYGIATGVNTLIDRLFGKKNPLRNILPHFERGGRPVPGMPAIFGERGPEIFIPDEAGSVYSNRASKGMMGEKISVHVTNTGDQHFYNESDPEIVATKTANKLVRKLRYA